MYSLLRSYRHHHLYILCLVSLILFACTPAASSPTATPLPPTKASSPTSEPTTPPTAAPSATATLQPTLTLTAAPLSPTPTVDACAGATDSGARLTFIYEAITPCLDTPEKVVEFMTNNLAWDGGWDQTQYGDNGYAPASEVYAAGADDCDGLAEFAACMLSQNGWEAYNVGISILGSQGHNVAGFVAPNGNIYSIHNGIAINGPFASWEELAQYFIDNGSAAPDGVIWLFDPCIQEITVGEDLLNLPHTVIR